MWWRIICRKYFAFLSTCRLEVVGKNNAQEGSRGGIIYCITDKIMGRECLHNWSCATWSWWINNKFIEAVLKHFLISHMGQLCIILLSLLMFYMHMYTNLLQAWYSQNVLQVLHIFPLWCSWHMKAFSKWKFMYDVNCDTHRFILCKLDHSCIHLHNCICTGKTQVDTCVITITVTVMELPF